MSTHYQDEKKRLLKYTQQCFKQAMGTANPSDAHWSTTSLLDVSLYLYPDTIEQLLSACEVSIACLKDTGWYRPDLLGCAFLVWYHYGKVQLCKVDLQQQTYTKPPAGLNTDTPFNYGLCAYQKPLSHVVCVASPLDALILNSQHITSLATYSVGVQKQQIKRLAQLECPLYLLALNSGTNHSAMEHAVEALLHVCEVSVSMHESLGFIHKHNALDVITRHAKTGEAYLVERIMGKRNGASDHHRNVRINQLAQQYPKHIKSTILDLAKSHGAAIYPPISESLQFLSALLDAQMELNEAKSLVQKRYGMEISITHTNKRAPL
jgi:hypothetical protein